MFSFLIKAKICLNIPTSNSTTLVFPSVLWNWYDARMGLLRLLDFDQRGNQAEFSAEQIQSCMFLIFSTQSLSAKVSKYNDDKNNFLYTQLS